MDQIDGVKESCLIGIKMKDEEDTPIAFIVKDSSSVDDAKIIEKLSSFTDLKIGKVHFLDALPKSPAGKVLKWKLQQSVLKM
jgi:acyl-coenzyme A synthetase/AMP-(fatty) acid ligase